MKASFFGVMKWLKSKVEYIPAVMLLGLLIRLGFMAFSGHHDAFLIPWMSNWITEGHWQIYTFFYQMAQSVKTPIIWLSNPPLTYWTLAFWIWLTKLINILSVAGWNYLSPTEWQILFVHRMLFVTKTIYLLFDIATLWILVKLVPRDRQNLAVALWSLSPIVLFSSYVMGQTDIFPVFWFTAALWMAKRYFDTRESRLSERWLILGAVCIGVGAAYKMWPLLLLPGFVLMSTTKRKLQFLLLVVGLSPLLITVLPYLPSAAFREWVLFGHGVGFLGLGSRVWIQEPSIFVIFLSSLLAFAFLWQGERNFSNFWQFLALILIGFFTFNSFWEFYWMIWLMPFIILMAGEFPNGWFFWFFQSVYHWLYMIGGWAIGADVFLRAFHLSYHVPDMVSLVFGTGEMRYKLLKVLFSMWVTSLWMPLLISFLTKNEKKLVFSVEQKYAQVLIVVTQLVALFSCLSVIFYTGLTFNSSFWEQLRTAYEKVITLDPSFYVFWVVLCGLICGMLGLKMWIRVTSWKMSSHQ